LLAYLQNKQAYYLIRPVKRNRKKAQSLQDNGLNVFSHGERTRGWRMTVRRIGGVSFQIKCVANIVCIEITSDFINDFNSQINT
jgi:hypothetical protein